MFIKTPKVSKYYIYKQDLQARNHYYNISGTQKRRIFSSRTSGVSIYKAISLP